MRTQRDNQQWMLDLALNMRGRPLSTASASSSCPPSNSTRPAAAATASNRIAKATGKVAAPRDIPISHPAIDRPLNEDEQRRERQRTSHYSMSYDNPLFDTPLSEGAYVF